MKTVASLIRSVADFSKSTDSSIWVEKIKEVFGITCHPKEPGTPLDPNILRQTYNILKSIPVSLIKDCGVDSFYFSNTMGPSQSYSPNHGFYIDHSITLNNNIFYHPDVMSDFFDSKGHFLNRSEQTIYHETGHAADAVFGEISLKPEWLKLSGWSKEPKPGLKRLIIKGQGEFPDVTGEMFFDPKFEFTRFYAKRNSWDDFADSFSFYVGGLKDKVPENKRKYLDDLLKKYYK